MTEITLSKSAENKLRRRAGHLGLELKKSRRRDPQAPDHGRYALVDMVTGEAVGGKQPLVGIYHLSAADVERTLGIRAEGAAAGEFEAPNGVNAFVAVRAERIPPPDKDWNRWCLKRGLIATHGARRAWAPALQDYLNDAEYLVYYEGKLISAVGAGELNWGAKAGKEE